jgi:hypothetical protein
MIENIELENKANALALQIAKCSDVCASISDSNHPCHQVVGWQAGQFSPKITEVLGSNLHRPEPWTGDLAKAKMIFLSSNPSFDPAENFPTWNDLAWPDKEISQFGAQRFVSNQERNFGASDSPHPEIRDRTIRRDGTLSKEVAHWRWVRQFASFAMDKPLEDTSAVSDYVMTELVHCKSSHEEGVIQALPHCTKKWFEKIMEISPAKIVFVTGAKAGDAMASVYSDSIPDNWGSWGNSRFGKGKGIWPRTGIELKELVEADLWGIDAQLRNSCRIDISGVSRLVVYIARPGGGGGINSPWNHKNLIHPQILEMWQQIFETN